MRRHPYKWFKNNFKNLTFIPYNLICPIFLFNLFFQSQHIDFSQPTSKPHFHLLFYFFPPSIYPAKFWNFFSFGNRITHLDYPEKNDSRSKVNLKTRRVKRTANTTQQKTSSVAMRHIERRLSVALFLGKNSSTLGGGVCINRVECEFPFSTSFFSLLLSLSFFPSFLSFPSLLFSSLFHSENE